MSAPEIVPLRGLIEDAIDEITKMTDADPAACAASRALRLTRLTLQCFWLPAATEATATEAASRA